MRVVVGSTSPIGQSGSALVVIAYEGESLTGIAAEVDSASGGLLQRLKEQGDLSTKLGKVNLLHRVPGISADCLVVVGGGAPSDFDCAAAFRCGGAAAKRLADRPREVVGFDFGPLAEPVAVAAVAGAMNGCVGQDLFRAEKSLHPIEQLIWWSVPSSVVSRAEELARGMLLTRELVNLPPNYMFPEVFAKRAAEVAVSSGLELEVWDELRLRRERCGAMLAVAAGSTRPPRLLILRYAGKSQQAPLALVGKGVTFDSGGLSLKPSESMLSMKCDMAGAATVLGAMQAIAALQVKRPVVAVVGLVENMISGNCYKLGDVVTARSGKTIEIHNTDAEGRLVLADALNVALDNKPSQIVDLATLTGACLVALGTDICGLMSNDPAWQASVEAAAQRTGELLWPLPMHAHFAEQIQSKVADIKNVGEGRWGGAITAAKFLQEFVGTTPWAHLDIAGPAFYDSAKSFLDAGGTGVMVRTLVELAEAEPA
jgi:leucyl aminopeptidase